jgi:hypothetical protein
MVCNDTDSNEVAHYGGFSLPRMAKMSKEDALSLKNVRYLAF